MRIKNRSLHAVQGKKSFFADIAEPPKPHRLSDPTAAQAASSQYLRAQSGPLKDFPSVLASSHCEFVLYCGLAGIIHKNGKIPMTILFQKISIPKSSFGVSSMKTSAKYAAGDIIDIFVYIDAFDSRLNQIKFYRNAELQHKVSVPTWTKILLKHHHEVAIRPIVFLSGSNESVTLMPFVGDPSTEPEPFKNCIIL